MNFDFLTILLMIMSLGFLVGFFRLVFGPSHSDRLLALDLMMILMIGVFSILYLMKEFNYFLDLILILALTSFVSTIAFCRFLQKGKT